MVHFYVLNPARKLRLLTTLFYRGSKRILGSVDSTSVLQTKPKKTNNPSLFKIALQAAHPIPIAGTVRDVEYYKESDPGFCIFQVENTIFKVHKVLLAREPSAFGDMFTLPQQLKIVDGTSDEVPIRLSDTAAQFRDLLWALYAPPNELFVETQIDRLLNVAELTNKYCFSSFETWVIERIYQLAQEPLGLLRSSSPEVCARILDVAMTCNHRELQDLVTQHLISRILWYNTEPEAVIVIAEKHGLRTLQGVCYYRQLISKERISRDGWTIIQPRFSREVNTERRMRFLAAHHSLLNLWETLRASPPILRPDGCLSHTECVAAWQHMWFEAGEANESLRKGSADVLGRLKSVMISLRKTMADAPTMSLQCKLAALEAITESRDEVIDGLMDHFMEAF